MAYQVEQLVEGEWSSLWITDASFLPRTFANAEAAQEALFRYRKQRLFVTPPLGHFRIVSRSYHHLMLDFLRVYQRLHREGLSQRHLASPSLLDHGKNQLRLHLLRLHRELGRAIRFEDVLAYFDKQAEKETLELNESYEAESPSSDVA
ncbi:hypothetical protein ACKC9G_01515 [Pokkaliibacter sp. CJK22405]|uniref:hypothetical protein n=1 Tax=Pokkaliibacter sp. CJK22405 TaxID=3384615 RepID=UPI003984815F